MIINNKKLELELNPAFCISTPGIWEDGGSIIWKEILIFESKLRENSAKC